MDETGVRADIGGATGLRVEDLSERKRRILDGVAAGKSNGVLARELGISVDGVKWHVSELLGDTDCVDRHELAAWWRRVRGPVAPAALTLGWPSRATLAGFGRFALGVAMTAVLALGVIAGWQCSGSSGGSATASPGAVSALGKVAYVLDGDIWVKSLPDGKPRQITHRTAEEREAPNLGYSKPAWSRSGDWLSAWAGQIPVIMRADGSNARSLQMTTFATWSPVADKIAYTYGGDTPKNVNEIVVEDADGSDRHVVASCPACGIEDVTWRSDGAEVAYVEHTSGTPPEELIKHVPATGGVAPEVYFSDAAHPTDGVGIFDWQGNPNIMLLYLVSNFSGSVLADGVEVEATHEGQDALIPLTPAHPVALLDPSLRSGTQGDLMMLTDGSGRESWTNKRIAIVSRASGTANDITPSDMAAVQPALREEIDAYQLAYSAAPSAGTDVSGGDAAKLALAQRKIWLGEQSNFHVDSFAAKRQLTSDPAYRDEFPQFSPDEKQILFARMDAHDEWSLWLIPSAGGDARQVVPKVDVANVLGSGEPAWFGYYGTIPWHDVFDWWRGDGR